MKIEDPEMESKILIAVSTIGKFLDKKTIELFDESDSERRIDFILSCAINLCGNLSMHHAKEEVICKQQMAEEVTNNLIVWFETALSNYRKMKESH